MFTLQIFICFSSPCKVCIILYWQVSSALYPLSNTLMSFLFFFVSLSLSLSLSSLLRHLFIYLCFFFCVFISFMFNILKAFGVILATILLRLSLSCFLQHLSISVCVCFFLCVFTSSLFYLFNCFTLSLSPFKPSLFLSSLGLRLSVSLSWQTFEWQLSVNRNFVWMNVRLQIPTLVNPFCTQLWTEDARDQSSATYTNLVGTWFT